MLSNMDSTHGTMRVATDSSTYLVIRVTTYGQLSRRQALPAVGETHR